MKKKVFSILAVVCFALSILVLGFGAGMLTVADNNQSESTQTYKNQSSVVVKGNTEFKSESFDFEVTPAPEVPVYDPAEVDEGMGEIGIPPGEEADIPEGWVCDGPAYLCRGGEMEEDREREYEEWLNDQEAPSAEEEAEAEANAPWTCEGSGSYGDYSPEGYEGCP